MAAACSALHSAFQLALMDAVRPGMDWEEAVCALRQARDRLAAPLAVIPETCTVPLPDTREENSLVSALQAGFRQAMSTIPVPANTAVDERPLRLQA